MSTETDLPVSIDFSFRDNQFHLALGPGEEEIAITTSLALDTSSSGFHFEVLPMAKKNLPEDAIHEVWYRGDSESDRRIGWVIPANALSSDQHDFALNEHFLKYAYATIREVLDSLPELVRDALQGPVARRDQQVAFSDLFHDNVCFVIICKELAGKEFDFDRAIPTLISFGFLPLSACDPAEIDWECRDVGTSGAKLKVRATGLGVRRPELPAKMMTIAASSRGSAVTQFFYLYQVVELLMDEVLYAVLPNIGRKVTESINEDQYFLLRDHLESLQSQLGEKARLKLMMKSFAAGEKEIEDLALASAIFLEAVGSSSREGVFLLYEVRNFIVHQARNIPIEAESQLQDVVFEFASFLPKILHNFDRTSTV